MKVNKIQSNQKCLHVFSSHQQQEITSCEHVTDTEHNSADASKSGEADSCK